MTLNCSTNRFDRHRPEHDVKLLHNRMTKLYCTVQSTTLNCSLPDIKEFYDRPEHDVKLLLARVTESSHRAAHFSTSLRPRITATTSILNARRVFILDGFDELIPEWLYLIYQGHRGFGGSFSEHFSGDCSRTRFCA